MFKGGSTPRAKVSFGDSESGLLISERRELPTLDRIPSKLPAFQFVFVITLPMLLIVLVLAVLVHDVISPYRYSDTCRTWSIGGPDWAGLLVFWLSMDWSGEHTDCANVLPPDAAWDLIIILPIAWAIIVSYAHHCRALTSRKGAIFATTREMLDSLNPSCDTCVALATSFCKDVRRMRSRHVFYVLIFQAIMFLIDYFLYKKSFRWILAYQAIWLGFSSCILQVRPTIKYCVFLSQILLDTYILRVLRHEDPLHLASWCDLIQMHRKLELEITNMWRSTQLAVLVPSLPFVLMAIFHFVSDSSMTTSIMVSSFLLVIASLVFISILLPIANVSRHFNSSSARDGEPTKGAEFRRGSLAVVAVIRRCAQEPKNAAQNASYMTLLELVQGHLVVVKIGIPGFMVGVTHEFVASTFGNLVVKFPLLVSIFLGIRGDDFGSLLPIQVHD